MMTANRTGHAELFTNGRRYEVATGQRCPARPAKPKAGAEHAAQAMPNCALIT